MSYLYYADRVMEFPLGVFGIALATAVLPSMSSQAARGEHAALRSTLGFALRLSAFIAVPAAVGLVALAEPIVRLLLERGAFGATESLYTAQALVGYAIGLPAFSATRITAQTFYALGDTRTPVLVGFVSVAANVVFALSLMGPLEHMGLALASSLSAYVNLAGLAWLLSRRLGGLGGAEIMRSLARTLGGVGRARPLVRLVGAGARRRHGRHDCRVRPGRAECMEGSRWRFERPRCAICSGCCAAAVEPCPSARGGARLRHAPEVLGDRPGQGLRISEGPIPGRRCFPPPFPQAVMDPVTEYLETLQMERGASRNTLAAYRRDLAGYAAFLARAGSRIETADLPVLVRYLGALRRRGLGGRSVARHLSAVRGLYRFLLANGVIRRDPTEHLDSPRPPRRLPRTLSEQDVAAIVETPDTTRPDGLRDRALLELLYALWAARLRSDRAAGRRRESGGRLRHGHRQGQPAAPGAHGGAGDRLDPAVPGRGT